jgi:tetraacyldisaccharide 4'-kinase
MIEIIKSTAAEIFSMVNKCRNFLFHKGFFVTYQSTLPVICAGNISMGGGGKTPTVIFLARELAARGYKPVVLSRGYKGKAQGPLLVTADSDYRETGDEPLLIARKTGAPVVISKNRPAGARFIEENNFGDIIILDDGLQHHWLERDINILCIDVSSEESINNILADKLAPASMLREKLTDVLPRISLVLLINKSDDAIDLSRLKHALRGKPAFNAVYQSKPPVNQKGEELDKESPITAFCGLANPEQFFKKLKNSGYNILKTYALPDHQEASAEELQKIRSSAPGNYLVCTEKDYIKLQSNDLYYLPIELNVDRQLVDLFLSEINM